MAIKLHYFQLIKKKKIRSYTYSNIDKLTNNFCKILLNNRLNKNTVNLKAIIHGSSSIETSISILACSKLGIHFSVIFEDLEIEAIKKRIKLVKPDIFITRFKKKKFNEKILSKLKNPSKIKFIFFDKLDNRRETLEIENKAFNSNKDFFTLFTSGSTGLPKGIVHAKGGYMVATKYTCINQFGMNEKSVILTASDAAWLNGHTYALFGPLSLGATSILMETPMLLLDENLLKKILKLKVSILYLPVTIIRLMKALFRNSKFKTKYLKTLGSMGEHLAPSVASWFAGAFTKKNKCIINAYYQTENGAIIASPTYKDTINKIPHGSVGKMSTKYLKTNKISNKLQTEIKLCSPWPGNMKRILNGKKEWNKYWDKSKFFRMFDLATNKGGNLYIHGRNDDVINIRGHRIGCEEVESSLLTINSIKECCAVSLPDKLEGEILYFFVVTKEKIEDQIIKKITNNFGSFALPKKIYYIQELPKTRSGKILRRLLRNILLNLNSLKKIDLSVIKNKKIIKDLIKKIKNEKNKS